MRGPRIDNRFMVPTRVKIELEAHVQNLEVVPPHEPEGKATPHPGPPLDRGGEGEEFLRGPGIDKRFMVPMRVKIEMEAIVEADGLAVFGFPTSPGVNYAVEYAGDIGSPVWSLSSAVSGNGLEQTVTRSLTSHGFFRVRGE